jgi:hypothetical protein
VIVQCEACGRIRLDRAWAWADFAVPDVTGICPTCLDRRARVARAQLARSDRKLLRDRARAGQGVQFKEDPFKGVQ